MSVLNLIKCQGTLLPFLQEWGYNKELNRNQGETNSLIKMHTESR